MIEVVEPKEEEEGEIRENEVDSAYGLSARGKCGVPVQNFVHEMWE